MPGRAGAAGGARSSGPEPGAATGAGTADSERVGAEGAARKGVAPRPGSVIDAGAAVVRERRGRVNFMNHTLRLQLQRPLGLA